MVRATQSVAWICHTACGNKYTYHGEQIGERRTALGLVLYLTGEIPARETRQVLLKKTGKKGSGQPVLLPRCGLDKFF